MPFVRNHASEEFMRKFLKFFLIAFIVLITLGVLFKFLLDRERKMALEVAVQQINLILKDENKRKEINIPSDLKSFNPKPVDTDIFELTWTFVFETKPKGYLEVLIYSPKGLPFLPLLNTSKELKLVDIRYHSGE